jgi:hypothetical protein
LIMLSPSALAGAYFTIKNGTGGNRKWQSEQTQDTGLNTVGHREMMVGETI